MRRLLALLLLWLAGLTVAQAEDWPPLPGRWEVAYLDEMLGPVRGTAKVTEDGRSVEIVYRHPLTGAAFPVRGTLEREGDLLRVRLQGRMPDAEGWRLPAWGLAVPAMPGEPLTLALGENSASLPVLPPALGEGRVELTLAPSANGPSLTGAWRQAVDPATGRLPGGGGRVGAFRLLYDGSGGAEMSGVESWHRPQPQAVLAFPLAEQFLLTYDQPDYPEPFDARGRLVRPLADRRLIVLLGRELPQDYGEPLRLDSLDPGIDYGIYRLPWDFTRPDMDRWPLQRAWELLARDYDAATLAAFRRLDLVILEARLRPGVLPGPKTFRLNGAEAAWLLQYGDWSGELAVARDIGFGQSEPADYLVPGETFYLQVMLDRPLPIAELPLLLAVGGEGEDSLRIALLGGERSVPLRQDAEEPQLYRSAPIQLVEPEYLDLLPPGTLALAALPGERIVATLAGDAVLRLTPSLAAAQVLQSPRHLKALLLGERKARGRTWAETVAAAAACAGATAPDLDQLSAAQADEYSDTIISSLSTGLWDDQPGWWITLSTKVTVGEHAGAIFLRDTFADLLAERARSLARPLDEAALRGFRQLVAGDLYGSYAALAAIEVTAPDGGQVTFGASFADSYLRERYGLTGEALDRYQLAAAVEARQRYLAAVEATRAEVAGIDDCDLDDLLKLTGFDFAPVTRVARQLLLRLEEEALGDGGATRPRWVADRRARAWLERVALVAQSLAEQKAIQKLDNTILLVAASVATLPLALMESPAALAVLFAIDAADAVYAGYGLVETLVAVSAERRLAIGASALLGSQRFHAAEARRYEWVAQAFGLLAASAGASYGFIESRALYVGLATTSMRWSANKLTASVRWAREAAAAAPDWTRARLQELLERYRRLAAESGDLATLRRRLADQSLEERVAAAEAIAEAEALAARLGSQALEAHESAALALRETMEQAAGRLRKPVWAEQLSDELYRQLGFRVEAPHVIAFFGRYPREMAELVAVPGAIDLLTRPWRSFEDFAAAVARLRERAPPLGPAFYEQMAPDALPPQGLHIAGGFTPARQAPYGAVDYHLYAGVGGERIGRFRRALEPDDQFGTGGQMLVLDLARRGPVEWLQGFVRPLTARGVPTTIYMNLRSMLGLGLRYADGLLTVVKFSNIISVNTCLELAWLRRLYPDAPWSELFRATHSFTYARNFLEQAGMRIDEVVIDESQWLIRGTPEAFAADGWFDGGDLAAALRGYEIPPNTEIDFGYDVYLRVSPR